MPDCAARFNAVSLYSLLVGWARLGGADLEPCRCDRSGSDLPLVCSYSIMDRTICIAPECEFNVHRIPWKTSRWPGCKRLASPPEAIRHPHLVLRHRLNPSYSRADTANRQQILCSAVVQTHMCAGSEHERDGSRWRWVEGRLVDLTRAVWSNRQPSQSHLRSSPALDSSQNSCASSPSASVCRRASWHPRPCTPP